MQDREHSKQAQKAENVELTTFSAFWVDPLTCNWGRFLFFIVN